MNAIPFAFIGVIYFAILGISLYLLILMIKLAQKGIQALDLYINEKSHKDF
ncbi:MAG: hypothetical protein K0R92_2242 [Lachnospiraceae bacterium]|jgi:hypothetical protein|nr:hypothetical protein [Lachnospiraceae bacterium]